MWSLSTIRRPSTPTWSRETPAPNPPSKHSEMRFAPVIFAKAIATLFCALAVSSVAADSTPTAESQAAFSTNSIRAILKRVADWQLTHPSATSNRYAENEWTWGAFYTGLSTWSRIADDPKY